MAEKKEKFLEITIERGVSFRVLGFIGLREDGVRIVNEQRAEKFLKRWIFRGSLLRSIRCECTSFLT